MRYVHSSTIEYRRGPAVDLSAPEAPSSNNIQRPLLVVTALSLSVSVALLLYLTLPSEADFNLAVATSIPVASLILCMMFARPSITDATFMFMGWALVYEIIIPWLLVTGMAVAYQGMFFINDYQLLARGNVPIAAGLLCYGTGMWLCSRAGLPRFKARRELLKGSKSANRVVAVLLFIAGLSWLIMWVRGGMPKESLLLIRVPNISGPGQQGYVANGFGYFLDLALSSNTAILVYALIHPEKSLFSRQMLLLLLAVLFFNSINDSRLVFAMAPASVLLLRWLMAERSREAARTGVSDTAPMRRPQATTLAFAAAILFVFCILYGRYREPKAGASQVTGESANRFALEAGHFLYYPIIYYMVLQRVPSAYPYWDGGSYLTPLISRVPRFLWPNKFAYMWTTQQFALEFYGYQEHHQLNVTAKGPNLLAEGYLNFGLAGVAGTMLLLGFVNEYLSRRARSRGATNLFLIIYVYYLSYLLPYIWKMGVADASVTVTPLLVLAFIVWLLSSAKQAASSARVHYYDSGPRGICGSNG